jgi:hypothetical protein
MDSVAIPDSFYMPIIYVCSVSYKDLPGYNIGNLQRDRDTFVQRLRRRNLKEVKSVLLVILHWHTGTSGGSSYIPWCINNTELA